MITQKRILPTRHRPCRAYARENDIGLTGLVGTGPKGRILKEDIDAALGTKKAPAKPVDSVRLPLDSSPLENFSLYGETETVDLSRIQKISAPRLHRSWLTIPHVTHFDESDITDLEAFRVTVNEDLVRKNIKLSLLVFIIKAVSAALVEHPLFNCSLTPENDKVILKRYYNVGVAVDTPEGLVVPVIKNVDRKTILEIAAELGRMSSAAREGKLAIPDIQGATFTISSLGGIGGTGFTPIVNGSQVAILGLSRSYQKPVWISDHFAPRLTLPFSVSYDHRAIDGAEAARFCRSLSQNIEDLKRTLL